MKRSRLRAPRYSHGISEGTRSHGAVADGEAWMDDQGRAAIVELGADSEIAHASLLVFFSFHQ